MLEQQQAISFSDYSSLYDLIIPKDNLLRQINDLMDFSFVYQELQDKYCHDNGRTAESPIRMFKYLLLKVIYNISDEDARTGHKTAHSSFFGYKTHMAMSDERIITAATVTSSEKGDGQQLPELIKKTEEAGMEVDSIVADKAYSSKENLKMAKENNMRLSARLSSVIDGNRTNKLPFEYNKDADLYVCPAGHLAKWKEMNNRKNDKRHRNSSITYYFDVDKCKVCPLRKGCYKEGAKTKTYAVTIKSDEQLEQIEYQKTEEFINLQRKRYKIEAKNSELKNVLGYDRALSYGLSCMEMQGALIIFAANVKRIIKLMQNA